MMVTAGRYAGLCVRRRREALWYDRLMSLSLVAEQDGVANIGISLLCLHPSDVRVVEAMLASRYPATEAVVMLDSDSELFAVLRRRYALCNVRCDRAAVKALYRSRHRAFRRLVVVDGFISTESSMLDVAASVCSYDYLMPIPSTCRLLPDALCRLAVEIAAAELPRVEYVECATRGIYAVSGDRVAACGGFGPLRAAYSKRASPQSRMRTLTLRHPIALPAAQLSEKDFFVFARMRTYNFYDFLLFNIMKYRKKFVSLIKP
ncbi:MAG: hypothetical protein IJ348_06610 [Alistipes sp.]|nr:hypothetical protein [Alistipes sp.]